MIALGVVGCVFAGVMVARMRRPPPKARSGCEQAAGTGDRAAVAKYCLQAHDATHDDHDLLSAAKAYVALRDFKHAEPLAGRLLTSALAGDARNLLSYIARLQGRVADAQLQALLASFVHMVAGDLRGVANDAVALSQAAWLAGDFTAAVTAAERGVALASRVDDAHVEVRAHITLADALRRLGDMRGASAALSVAIERSAASSADPCDGTWSRLKSGLCFVDAGEEKNALTQLAAVERADERCKPRDVKMQVAGNLAWLLRRRDPGEALAQIEKAVELDEEGADTLVLRAILATDRGALDEAEGYLARAEQLEAPQVDWPWEIACSHAELFEQRSGVFDDLIAEAYYRRSMALVASLRATAQARSAYLVSSHRGPYDGLLSLLARHGRWRDALAVVLELDASDMLRATAVERIEHNGPADDGEAPAPGAAVPPAPKVDDVLAAWQSQDLVIAMARSDKQIGSGDERVYRLYVHDGEVTGEDVGDAREVRGWAKALFEDPGNRQAAQALGRIFVPPGGSDRALHVLAIGSLGKVPLAALRDGDGALISRHRPLLRVLALRSARPASRGDGPRVVIADPRGNLTGARREGAIVAAALGAGVRASGAGTAWPATRAELWAARDAALLHIAGHVVGDGGRRVLPLADGDVDPAEILQGRVAPRVAVLASCGSAAAMDEEGWGSIAAALLEAGTSVVVATDHDIDDKEALAVMRALYAQPDWPADPARALARVQQAFDAAPSSRAALPLTVAQRGSAAAADPDPDAVRLPTWAAFSVLARPPVVP